APERDWRSASWGGAAVGKSPFGGMGFFGSARVERTGAAVLQTARIRSQWAPPAILFRSSGRCAGPTRANFSRAEVARFSTAAIFLYWLPAPHCGTCYSYVNTLFQPGGKRMPITTRDVRQTLMETDVEFRSLVEQHSRCESQLNELLTEPYLNSEALALE